MANVWMLTGAGALGAATVNGGGYATGGAATWANSMVSGGGPVVAETGVTYMLQGGENTDDRIEVRSNGAGSGTNEFADAKVGQKMYIQSTLEGASTIVELKVVEATGDYVEFATIAWTDLRADVVVNVGGALGGTAGADMRTAIQTAFNAVAAGDEIVFTPTIYTIADTSVAVDSGTVTTGTAAAKITVRGGSLATGEILSVGDTRPIIKANASIANQSPLYVTGTLLYYDWRFLDFQGGGANKADHAMYLNDLTNVKYHRFFNCLFSDCDLSPFHLRAAEGCLAIDCEMFGALGGVAGAYVRNSNHRLIRCICRDNTNGASGIDCRNSGSVIDGCKLYNNDGAGIVIRNDAGLTVVINNTVYGNTEGIDMAGVLHVVYNNVVSGNSGNQWNLNADLTEFMYFAYNHAFGGTGLVSSGAWADIGEGNNITGNPAFLNPAGGDFRIGNDNIRFAGKPDQIGRNTVMGATSPKYLGAIDLMRARYSEAYGGYAR